MSDALLLLGVTLSYLLPCVISLIAILLNLVSMWKRGANILLSDLALTITPFIPLFNIFLTLYVVFDLFERINWQRVVISRKKF